MRAVSGTSPPPLSQPAPREDGTPPGPWPPESSGGLISSSTVTFAEASRVRGAAISGPDAGRPGEPVANSTGRPGSGFGAIETRVLRGLGWLRHEGGFDLGALDFALNR